MVKIGIYLVQRPGPAFAAKKEPYPPVGGNWQ